MGSNTCTWTKKGKIEHGLLEAEDAPLLGLLLLGLLLLGLLLLGLLTAGGRLKSLLQLGHILLASGHRRGGDLLHLDLLHLDKVSRGANWLVEGLMQLRHALTYSSGVRFMHVIPLIEPLTGTPKLGFSSSMESMVGAIWSLSLLTPAGDIIAACHAGHLPIFPEPV